MGRTNSLALVLALTVVGTPLAADHPVVGRKLIVMTKPAEGRAKMVFVTTDAAVTKGAGVDPAQIDARLDVAYLADDEVRGAFDMPAGERWSANTPTLAKYSNRAAPIEGAVKSSVIKPHKLVKVAAKSLGDEPLDITVAPSGPVYVVHTVRNGEETNRHCTQFTECQHKVLAGGGGSKLVCSGKNSTGDPDCTAAVPCGLVDLGSTVLDTCTNLEWEKKDTAPGSGPDAGNLRDVDNRYSWAGRCTISPNVHCQPNAAAAATCAAQTGGARGCGQCGGADGTCNVDPLGTGTITTVWDWVNQLNAATFAGHADWRLATSAGSVLFPTGQPAELESIVDPTQGSCGGGSGPCIASVFGPTFFGGYWSASPEGLPSSTATAYGVFFSPGGVFSATTNQGHRIRAVRPAS